MTRDTSSRGGACRASEHSYARSILRELVDCPAVIRLLEVRSILGLSDGAVRSLIASGRLRALRRYPQGAVLIERAELERFVRARAGM